MHRIANPSRSVRLRPAPPPFLRRATSPIAGAARGRCGGLHTLHFPATSCFALIPVASNLAATVPATRARVAKLVDAAGLKPVAGQLAGSNPAPGTTAQ